MALYGRDANGNDAYIRGTGAGSTTDGYLTFHDVFSGRSEVRNCDSSSCNPYIRSCSCGPLAKDPCSQFDYHAAAACSVKFETGASAAVVAESLYLPINGTVALSNELGLFETASGDKLMINKTGAADITVTVSYREV